MFLLLFFGKSFGMSASMRAVCAAGGAGKKISFFDFDWVNSQGWNLLFALGAVIGGFIASNYLMASEPVQVAEATVKHLQQMGITAPQSLEEGTGYLPNEVFNFEALFTLKGFLLLVVGGFLVGFGSRYAGGCTSGHAISGLSNLQLPSLIAVIGFFIGGLLMTHILLPLILKL
jgi:uncharacterized membrane protein YedE/YeeE